MSTERDGQPPTAERYVLARQGLPLPRTLASVPRAPWLPAAVRSRALPSQARVLPLPPLAEPKWDEAFPPEAAAPPLSPMPQAAQSITPETSPHADAVPPGQAPSAPVSIASGRGKAMPRDIPTPDPRPAPEEAMAVAPPQRRMTQVVTSAVPAPCSPLDHRDQDRQAVVAVPEALVADPQRAPHPDQETGIAATVAPGLVASGLPSQRFSTADSDVRHDRTSTPIGADRIAPCTVASASDDNLPAPPTGARPSPTPAPPITRSPGADALVRTMGAPFMAVESAMVPAPVAPGARSVASPKPLGAAELAALHRPAPTPRSVRIDRVQVVVQATAASAPRPSGAPDAIPAPPSRASAPQGFRSPWSSYFTRRD